MCGYTMGTNAMAVLVLFQEVLWRQSLGIVGRRLPLGVRRSMLRVGVLG